MRINRLGIALQMCVLTACASVHAQSIVRVEEDWALQVMEPDEQLNSPQITTAMMPLGPSSSTIFFLDINHGTSPDYSAGGLQLRVDQNGECIESKRLLSGQKLKRGSETIKWTQLMEQRGNELRFGVIDGQSETWNHFGGPESFIDVPCAAGNLNLYRHTDSLTNSGVVYAENRVASLMLVRIRLFNSIGQMVEITLNQSPL